MVAEGATARNAADEAWLSDEYGLRGLVQEQLERVQDWVTDASPSVSVPPLREAVETSSDTRYLLITAGDVPDEPTPPRTSPLERPSASRRGPCRPPATPPASTPIPQAWEATCDRLPHRGPRSPRRRPDVNAAATTGAPMTTIVQPTATTPTPVRAGPGTLTTGYWLAGVIAVIGLVSGVALGSPATGTRQRDIDTFDRVTVPGAMTVQLDEADGRVVYFEGDDNVRFNDLTIVVTTRRHGRRRQPVRGRDDLRDPRRHAGTRRRHLQRQPGRDVRGRGQRRRHRATRRRRQRRAPGTARRSHRARGRRTALIAGFVLWLTTFINRQNPRTAVEPEENR